MSKRSLKRGGERPQAWFGTAVAIASTLAGLYNSYRNYKNQQEATYEQKRQQRLEDKYNGLLAEAKTIQGHYDYMDELENDKAKSYIFKCGGRLKLADGGRLTTSAGNAKITSGGYAQPIGPHIFLLQGRSHANGGINETFGKGKNEVNINAQGGEVQEDLGPKNSFVYSNSINLGNGLTPAKAVLAGYDRPTIRRIQQALNGDNKSTPVKGNKHKAEYGDWIKLGVDAGSALVNGIMTGRALKRLQDNANYVTPNYYEESPVLMNTRYNNSAQLATLERQRLANRRSIVGNTASSQIAQARLRDNDFTTALARNELLDYKANKEIELRNAQYQLEQGVRSRNAAAKNAWIDRVTSIRNAETDLRNNIRNMQLANINNTIAGLNQASENYFNTIEQRRSDKDALRAYMASSNPGTYATFIANGGLSNRENYNLYRSILEKDYKTEEDAMLAKAAYTYLTPKQIDRLRRKYYN